MIYINFVNAAVYNTSIHVKLVYERLRCHTQIYTTNCKAPIYAIFPILCDFICLRVQYCHYFILKYSYFKFFPQSAR